MPSLPAVLSLLFTEILTPRVELSPLFGAGGIPRVL